MKILKLALIILLILTGARLLMLTAPARASAVDSTRLMEKINRERINRAIPALVSSPKLSLAAQIKTDDMFARDYFDHLDPDGNYVWPLVEKVGYRPYKMLGENLAIDFSTEDGIVRAWMNSPTHRDNILRAEFADQGLNASYGDFQNRYTSLVTSLFGVLAEIPAPAVKPTVKPEVTPAPPQQEISGPTAEENKNEPAVRITAPKETISTTTPQFSVTYPKTIAGEEMNIFHTVRTVFILLVASLLFTVIMDALRSKPKGLWDNSHLSVMILLLMVSVLTFNLY